LLNIPVAVKIYNKEQGKRLLLYPVSVLIMNKFFAAVAFLFCFNTINIHQSYGQVRSSVGFGIGVNHPLQGGYRFGKDWAIQANIRTSKKAALVPAIGIESVEGNNKGTYNGYYFTGSGRSVNLVFLRLAGKYYFNNNVFGFAGPALYVGGDDAGSSGIGGSIGVGYDMDLDNLNNLEFTFRTDVRPVYSKMVPVAALGIAYKFNFTKRY
jgi:hypothetical protein